MAACAGTTSAEYTASTQAILIASFIFPDLL